MLGCAYAQYDKKSLTPITAQTEYRLRQLGWTRQEFEGRSVLDIGCNRGALSVMAAQFGAAKVVSIDPNQEFVDDFSEVLAIHPRLNISVSRRALGSLTPENDAADIVLFMEVLHWAVAQGASLASIIKKLWGLTRHTLYIEFPWSIDEPSIRAQTQLTEATYSADLVFEELDRAFADVQVVTFMRYFGLVGPAKRVLVRASKPRPEYLISELFPQVCSIGVLGERSSNYFMPLLTSQGMKLFKQVSPHSCLSQLPLEVAETLLRDIAAMEPRCLVAPEAIDGRYLLEHNGSRYLILPYVSRQRVSFTTFSHVSLKHIYESVIGLRRDLRTIKPRPRLELIDYATRQRHHALPISSSLKTYVVDVDNELARCFNYLIELGVKEYPHAQELCHGDLQIGNIVIDEHGCPRVVDLDTLTFGTKFTDALCALSWAGTPENDFLSLLEKIEQDEGEHCVKADFAISLLMINQWFRAIEKQTGSDISHTIKHAQSGIVSLLLIASRRFPNEPAHS